MSTTKEIAERLRAAYVQHHGNKVGDPFVSAIAREIAAARGDAPAPARDYLTFNTADLLRRGDVLAILDKHLARLPGYRGPDARGDDLVEHGYGNAIVNIRADVARLVPSGAPAPARDAGEVVEAARWVREAANTLDDLAEDTSPIPDDWELCRIDESRRSPSFRIRAGHIRRLAAALSAYDAAPEPVTEEEVGQTMLGKTLSSGVRDLFARFTITRKPKEG